ncbi:MAG: exonuclease SbcCD subunit D [Candidatus Verstraetearchaeota archaeon]|nr:exonuclease SbcCD subunit D [Candidatus Verstraetearchaeota archaeon]
MKFAHMADIHLGATSDPKLRELEINTLRKAFEICIKENVDFILISGDLFHVNIPDLSLVKEVVRIMKKVIENKIKIYVVYGSHDYSPNAVSIVDILEEVGIITRVGRGKIEGGLFRPEVIVDERSNAVITGISARKLSLEREVFKILDREYLSSLKGYKIFMFHTAIDELKRKGEHYEGISSTDLPSGFDYYAGGHMHRRIEYGKIFYPGPLFTGWGVDLENTVKGERRGFYIVENGKPKFIDLTPFEGIYKEINVTGRSAFEVNNLLKEFIEKTDVKNKVIVLKVYGELIRGKTSDIDFSYIKSEIMKRGAIYLHLNRSQLRSKEFEIIISKDSNSEKVEEEIFMEVLKGKKFNEKKLLSLELPKALFNQLKVQKKEGEVSSSYEKRIKEAAIEVLGIKDLIEG